MDWLVEDDLSADLKQRVLLDFGHCNFRNREEFRKALNKVPDLRIKFEKVKEEDLRLTSAKETLPMFPFRHPVPDSLRDLEVRDFSRIDIHWKMLTLIRPDTKSEEEFFSRLVQLEKLKRETAILEANEKNEIKKPHHKVKKGKEKESQSDHVGRQPSCDEEDFHYDFYERSASDRMDALEESTYDDVLSALAIAEHGGKVSTLLQSSQDRKPSKKSTTAKSGHQDSSKASKKKTAKKPNCKH